jgi:hypothetical protein
VGEPPRLVAISRDCHKSGWIDKDQKKPARQTAVVWISRRNLCVLGCDVLKLLFTGRGAEVAGGARRAQIGRLF